MATERTWSCASPTFCVEISEGGSTTQVFRGTFAAPTSLGSTLYAISCPSTEFCLAVDQNASTVVKYENGHWARPRYVGHDLNLNSGAERVNVSCASSRLCAAVDSFDHVATFNGRSWSAPRLLDASTSTSLGVSCTKPAFCLVTADDGHAYTYNG